jgi:hypothetical protein
MAQKTKYDPLEAAKVTDKTKAKDEVSATRTDWDTTDTEAPPPPVAAPVVQLQATPATMPTKVTFEVVEAKLISLGANGMHRFKAGDRLDPAGYGGEERLHRLGLNLRRIEE